MMRYGTVVAELLNSRVVIPPSMMTLFREVAFKWVLAEHLCQQVAAKLALGPARKMTSLRIKSIGSIIILMVHDYTYVPVILNPSNVC